MAIGLIFTLCTVAACNSYQIDTLPNAGDCQTSLVIESDFMARVWPDQSRLEGYLAPFAIQEAVGELTDYDYTCEPVGKSAQQWVSR